jgi:hypothetical protein
MPTPAATWRELLNRCLAELERQQIGSPCPLVDHEVVQTPSDEGGDAEACLICRTRAEARIFADTELTRARSSLGRKLLAGGFPEAGLASLRLTVSSREELAAGGRFRGR